MITFRIALPSAEGSRQSSRSGFITTPYQGLCVPRFNIKFLANRRVNSSSDKQFSLNVGYLPLNLRNEEILCSEFP